jgi:hypothetical protein
MVLVLRGFGSDAPAALLITKEPPHVNWRPRQGSGAVWLNFLTEAVRIPLHEIILE